MHMHTGRFTFERYLFYSDAARTSHVSSQPIFFQHEKRMKKEDQRRHLFHNFLILTLIKLIYVTQISLERELFVWRTVPYLYCTACPGRFNIGSVLIRNRSFQCCNTANSGSFKVPGRLLTSYSKLYSTNADCIRQTRRYAEQMTPFYVKFIRYMHSFGTLRLACDD